MITFIVYAIALSTKERKQNTTAKGLSLGFQHEK